MQADELVTMFNDAIQIAKETKKVPTAVYQFSLSEGGMLVRGLMSFAPDQQPVGITRHVTWHEILLTKSVNAIGEAVLKIENDLAAYPLS
jgi:hypothetical protein